MMGISVYLYFFALFVIGLLLLFFVYVRPKAQQAFLRTGFGGDKVIFQKGGVVLPSLHQLNEVSLKTHAVDIALIEHKAVLTKDHFKVDINMQCLFRVTPEPHAVAVAARSLGMISADTEQLKALFQDTLIAIIHNTISHYTFDELNDIRTEVAHEMYRDIDQAFFKNGLEVISVSLPSITQTEKAFLNLSNQMDAKVLEMMDQCESDLSLLLQRNQLKTETEKLDVEIERMSIDQQKLLARLQQTRRRFEEEAAMRKELAEMDVANQLAIKAIQEDAEAVYRQLKAHEQQHNNVVPIYHHH
ncbi:MAG: SPFH domain-containing protein [bacterium]